MFKFLFGALLIGSGFFLTLFRDPVWGLYLFAATAHIRLVQLAESISLPLQTPIFIASLTLIVYLVSPQYRPKFSKWPAEIWLFGFMVLGMCITSFTAHFNSAASWDYTLNYVKYFIFFIMLIQMVDSIEKVEWFHRVMILSSVWLVYRCWDLRYTTGERFENVGGDYIGDANNFAAALILLFPFVFQKVLCHKLWISICAAILCFGIIMAIIISVSRGGFLGLFALMLLILNAFPTQRKKIFMSLVVLGLLAFLFTSDYQIERLSTIFESEESRDESAQSRIRFWKLALQLFVDYPLTGVGFGNFWYYSGYLLEGKPYGIPGHVTHNTWMELLSGGGLVVTVPFVLLLFIFFRNSSYLIRRYLDVGRTDLAYYIQTPRIALAAFLVCATFLDRGLYEPFQWCIALGVIHRYIFLLKFASLNQNYELGPKATVHQRD